MKKQYDSDHGTIVNCLDGTVQLPAINFAKHIWKVSWVDVITEAAPEKILSEAKDKETISRIHQNIESSLCGQQTKRLAIVSHSGCDINKAPDDKKKEMLRQAIGYLKERYTDADVIGIWVDGKIKASNIEL
jgi:hypothetical protein